MTETDQAKEIITLRDRELQRQSNFRSLWQSIADMMFPQTYGITAKYMPGSELMNNLFDTTAMEEAENMTSGLCNQLFPAGQPFFAIKSGPGVSESYGTRSYLQYLSEQAHEAIFNSNFITQVNNTIHYWVTFGIGNLYSEWTVDDGLNYRDYSIGTYQCLENAAGIIRTNILTCTMSAAQIVERWGLDKVGKAVQEAYSKPESQNEEFSVIHVTRPRPNRNPDLIGADNMPFQSIFVNEKDALILENGGYQEFPFAIPRYQVIYREVYGRGRGTMLLPAVRTLNRLSKDFSEMSNKWVNPPKEVLESFDGNVNVTPGALNVVTTIPSIKAIDMGANGAYPVGKEILEYRREEVRQGFFKNAFEAVTNLEGDRRTTVEIIERLKEGMRKLSKPIGRLFNELLTPTITRSVLLLIRNGVVQRPPRELGGEPFKIEFINPLALALRDQQTRGVQYWITALGQMESLFPGVKDNCDYDAAARDMGESLGVKSTHIRSKRARDEIREQREEQMEQQNQMAMAGAAAEAYEKTTGAPEPGSPLGGQ